MYYEIYWRSANGERGHVTQGDCKVPKRKEREPLEEFHERCAEAAFKLHGPQVRTGEIRMELMLHEQWWN